MRLLSFLAAGLGWIAMSAGAQPAADRAELRKLYQEAVAAHQRKDYASFLDLSRKIVEKAPRSVELSTARSASGSGPISTLSRTASTASPATTGLSISTGCSSR